MRVPGKALHGMSAALTGSISNGNTDVRVSSRRYAWQ